MVGNAAMCLTVDLSNFRICRSKVAIIGTVSGWNFNVYVAVANTLACNAYILLVHWHR